MTTSPNLPRSSLWNAHLEVHPRPARLHGTHNVLRGELDARPTRRTEYDDRDTPGLQVLLVLEVGVGCEQESELVVLCGVDQLSVLESCPTKLLRRAHLVRHQELPKRRRRSLVEQDSHLRRGERAARRVFKDSTHLFERDAGKPLDELRDGRTIFEVLEQRRDRHATAAEYPGTAASRGITLDGLTGGPVDHAQNGSTRRAMTPTNTSTRRDL